MRRSSRNTTLRLSVFYSIWHWDTHPHRHRPTHDFGLLPKSMQTTQTYAPLWRDVCLLKAEMKCHFSPKHEGATDQHRWWWWQSGWHIRQYSFALIKIHSVAVIALRHGNSARARLDSTRIDEFECVSLPIQNNPHSTYRWTKKQTFHVGAATKLYTSNLFIHNRTQHIAHTHAQTFGRRRRCRRAKWNIPN